MLIRTRELDPVIPRFLAGDAGQGYMGAKQGKEKISLGQHTEKMSQRLCVRPNGLDQWCHDSSYMRLRCEDCISGKTECL